MIEEGIKLLEKDWANEEKILIQRLLDNLISLARNYLLISFLFLSFLLM